MSNVKINIICLLLIAAVFSFVAINRNYLFNDKYYQEHSDASITIEKGAITEIMEDNKIQNKALATAKFYVLGCIIFLASLGLVGPYSEILRTRREEHFEQYLAERPKEEWPEGWTEEYIYSRLYGPAWEITRTLALFSLVPLLGIPALYIIWFLLIT